MHLVIGKGGRLMAFPVALILLWHHTWVVNLCRLVAAKATTLTKALSFIFVLAVFETLFYAFGSTKYVYSCPTCHQFSRTS